MQDMILFFVFYALVIISIILASFTEKKIVKIAFEEDVDESEQSFGIEGQKSLVCVESLLSSTSQHILIISLYRLESNARKPSIVVLAPLFLVDKRFDSNWLQTSAHQR